MSRVYMFLVAACIAGVLTACGNRTGASSQAASTTERKGKIIRITDTVLNAGGTDTVRFRRLHSGEIAVQQVWIANDATRATAITAYERTCGCTMLCFDSQPIEPAGAQRVQITFDSRGEWGWQLKLLDLHLAGAPKTLRIFVEAEVE